MEQTFERAMASKTTEELIKITQIDRENYQTKAVELAEKELRKRNISLEAIEKTRGDIADRDAEKLERQNNTVGSGLRFANFLIDLFAWLIIAFILTLPLNAHKEMEKLIGYLILFASYFLYYAILEAKFQKTLGKMITKTIVVTYKEEKPTVKDILIRTLFRFIPFDQVSFLFTPNGFHDMLSHTKVVK